MTDIVLSGSLGEMMARHAQDGRVEEVFVRSQRRSDIQSVQTAGIDECGLEGDHASAGKRAVTLIQAEHLAAIASLLGRTEIDAALLRRNIVVAGINLLGLRKSLIEIGTSRLLIHGPCPPCSRMEEILGAGGYSAMRGHGGVYAEVIAAGSVQVGSALKRLA